MGARALSARLPARDASQPGNFPLEFSLAAAASPHACTARRESYPALSTAPKHAMVPLSLCLRIAPRHFPGAADEQRPAALSVSLQPNERGAARSNPALLQHLPGAGNFLSNRESSGTGG